jgi:small-conductance mechanosensitive channel
VRRARVRLDGARLIGHARAVRELLDELDTWIQEATGLSPGAQERLLATALTLLCLWAVRVLVLRLVARHHAKAEARGDTNIKSYYYWRKATAYVVFVLAFLMVGRIWLESFASLATVIGLASAGVAVALKDPLVNFAGWVFIVWRKPFELGDRVEIGKYRGDVVDQGVFTFSLMEIGNWVNADDRTGRLLIAPNGLVFTDVLANYSKGWFEHIWNELQIIVTYESDWRAAKQLLADIAREHGSSPSEEVESHVHSGAQKYLMLAANFQPRVFTAIEEVGVGLTVRYLCTPFNRRATAEAIWEDILDAVHARSDIDFAYPTIRYYDNIREGKADARAPGQAPVPGA